MKLQLSVPLLATLTAVLMAQTGGDPQPTMKCDGEHNWGDDTPVPPDVFGALWPEGQTPAWALPK